MSDRSSARSSAISLPSFVANIDLNVIALLATSVRNKISGSSIDRTVTVDPDPRLGSYNVVWFIEFSDGISWVLRTPKVEWSSALEARMRSDILGLKLISTQTDMLVPKIHDFSIEKNPGTFSRPYVLMEKLKGTLLSRLWFEKDWFTEERRKRVWKGIVENVVQLKNLKFDKIGSLVEVNGEVTVGEFISSSYAIDAASDDDEETTMEMEKRGPYTSAHIYLLDGIKRQMDAAKTKKQRASLSLLRIFAGALPDEEHDGPPFVLSMPDFGYQNVLVDEGSGEVTGLIDWEDITVGPRQLGYARYPSWITRDWDPALYGWPQQDDNDDDDDDDEGEEEGTSEKKEKEKLEAPRREELNEDSPETLQSFRKEYHDAFEKVDPESAKYTRNSHIFEAVDIAISNSFFRTNILDKLAKYVFGEEAKGGELAWWNLEQGISSGNWLQG